MASSLTALTHVDIDLPTVYPQKTAGKLKHKIDLRANLYEQQQEEQFYNHAINISTLWIQQKGANLQTHGSYSKHLFTWRQTFSWSHGQRSTRSQLPKRSWDIEVKLFFPEGFKRSVVPHCTCCWHHKQVVYWLSWCTISGILFLKEVPMNHDMPELVKHQWIRMKHKPWRPTNH